jgi:hypothetical protein
MIRALRSWPGFVLSLIAAFVDSSPLTNLAKACGLLSFLIRWRTSSAWDPDSHSAYRNPQPIEFSITERESRFAVLMSCISCIETAKHKA